MHLLSLEAQTTLGCSGTYRLTTTFFPTRIVVMSVLNTDFSSCTLANFYPEYDVIKIIYGWRIDF